MPTAFWAVCPYAVPRGGSYNRAMTILRSLALLLILALAVPARSGPVEASAGRAWSRAVSEAAVMVSARPDLASGLNTATLLGRLRLELSMNPGSEAALSFLAQIPHGQASGAALKAMGAAEKLKLIELAAASEALRLEKQAVAVLARVKEGGYSKADLVELETLSSRWFYLPEELAGAVEEAVYEGRSAAALTLADKVANQLKDGKQEKPLAVVTSELNHVFAGAVAVVNDSKDVQPGSGLVGTRLAPYVARALDEAEKRAQERGVAEGQVYKAVIEGHAATFGAIADRGLFKTLRERGEWTEFVAAASLHAGNELTKMGAQFKQVLASAAEGDDLRLAIPSWHGLHGMFPSVAHWLQSVHGPAEDDSNGRLLFKVWGIPVKADRSMPIALALGTWQFSTIFGAAFHGQLPFIITAFMGLAATVLLYATVVAHEMGHAAAARAFGIRTRHMVINWMGGGARVVRGFRQALPEFVIALAGPVVSALCGLALVWLGGSVLQETMLGPIFRVIGSLNFLLAGYNLLPIFPMDGGRILRAGLTRFVGSYRATKVASIVGMLGAGLLAYSGLMSLLAGKGGLMMLIFGVFFAVASKAMGVHAGTVTIDERPSKKK
jgi:Zn-dependent protease